MELKVEKLLKDKRIGYRLVKLSRKAYTVADVVRYSEGNVNSGEICKTIILKGKVSGKKTAVFLRGDDKINFSEIKKIFKEETAIANSEEVKEAAGVEPGAVCPFLLDIPIFVDRRVLGLEKINCGSGNHLYGLEFKTEDLIKGMSYEIADLAKSSDK